MCACYEGGKYFVKAKELELELELELETDSWRFASSPVGS
jgi:hypothetical protein